MGDVFFEGYEIGEYIKSYEIAVKIYKGTTLLHQFTISPNKPYYNSYGYYWPPIIEAALVGDVDAYEGAMELDNYILYIPVSPQSNSMVQDYQHNMLLVPREEVSKDGGEPDKVGVSFHTFRLLGSDCKVSEAGDGLGNQLVHKHNLDIQKLVVNPDAETTYLVHGKQDFKESMNFTAGMPKTLVRAIPYINNSLVSLTVSKANMVQTIEAYESKGIIRSAYIERFPSMSNKGLLQVVISNAGDTRANYIVTVSDATANILNAFPAQARTLNPGEETTLGFDVSTVQNIETTHNLMVTLRSPGGKIYDSVQVIFDTTQYTTKYSWELRQKNEDSEVSLPADNSPPVITLNGPNTITLECGIDSYTELGAEAVDDTDPNIEVVIGGDTVDTTTCGTYSVIYSAKDSTCNIAHEVRIVEVRDTTAPELELAVEPNILWPANNKMVLVKPTWMVTDNCDKSPEVTLVSITSNENSKYKCKGPKDKHEDIKIGEDGSIYLRAECNGKDGSRVYTITYQATDDSGNLTVKNATVEVPCSPKHRWWLHRPFQK
jgi:hypothetical protein